MRNVVLASVAASILSALPAGAQVIQESPGERDARMAWWREARFGMFIHWGVYATYGGEYDGNPAPGVGEWIMETAHIPVSAYEKQAATFNPVKYDAAEWVRIAKAAGMRYIVITSKHHDGFGLWDSGLTDWDVERTPGKRDLLKPLADACKAEGIRFCLYHSIMDWHHPDYAPRRAWNDVAAAGGEPDFAKFPPYVGGQVEELIMRFDPGVLWFDGEWESTWTPELGGALERHARTLKPDIIINNRVGKSRGGMAGMNVAGVAPSGDFGTPEQEIPSRGFPGVDWETCMTMNDTWGFRKDDTNWKSNRTLIRQLIDIASKGGNFLLNVGPTPEGEIPEASIERLRAMGAWLDVNGEAIHGTVAGPFERLPWGRCTRRGDRLYLHVFDWPSDGIVRVPGLKNTVSGAVLLAAPTVALSTNRDGEDYLIAVGSTPPDAIASVIRVDIEGEPEVTPWAVRADAHGVLTLSAADATLSGHAHLESIGGQENIGYWLGQEDGAAWTIDVGVAGQYDIILDMACQKGDEGDTVEVHAGNGVFSTKVKSTGAWSVFDEVMLGRCQLKVGRQDISVRAGEGLKGALMNLRSVTLKPVGQNGN